MPSRSAHPLWDPSTLLSVNPSKQPTCVGLAHSQGRQCQNQIHRDNCAFASSVLDELEETPLEEWKEIRKLLEDLAYYVLCKGVHRRQQIDETVDEWKGEIRQERKRQEEEERSRERRRRERRRERRQEEEEERRRERRMERREESESVSESDEEEGQVDLMTPNTGRVPMNPPLVSRVPRSPRTSPPPTATTTRTAAPPAARQREPRSAAAPRPAATPRETRSPPMASVPLPPPIPTSTPQSPRLPPHRPHTPPQPRPTTKGAQKPIHRDSECPICYGLLLPKGEPMSLVWCKGECGQNVHAECWRKWEKSQIGEKMEARCAICRGAWVN